MTLTTFDDELCRIIEPHVSTTQERIKALHVLKEHGIPTVVWLCPVLPYINDTEENIQAILDEDAICVLGNEALLKKEEALFGRLEPLFQS